MLALRGCLVLVCLLTSPFAASSDEEDHEHEGNHSTWEWAGVFELDAGETYTWSASRVDGAYADPEMQILIVPTTEASEEGIHSVEETAEDLWEANDIGEVDSGEKIPLSTAVHLHFDPTTWVSIYKIMVDTTGPYVIFAQHFPTEFEEDFHYLKDEHGEDVEPLAEEEGGHHDEEGAEDDHEDEHKDRWGLVIGGTLITVLPAFLLIALAGPAVQKLTEELLSPLSCFASGAIMAAAVFLMLPEGFLLAGVDQEEVTATWTWGTAVLGGWFFGTLVHMVTDTARHGAENAAQKEGEEGAGGKAINWSVAVPVLFGDFWHNIVDGFVIGFAAKACDTSLVWSIIAATAGHEIPQEFGDFVILLNKANMHWIMAACLNLASGMSAVLGAIIAYEVDVSSNLEGIALAFGAGVYLFVAATELGPAFLEMTTPSAKQAAMRLLFFVVGTVCIGLVLTNHEHCIAAAAAGEEGASAGNGHAHR